MKLAKIRKIINCNLYNFLIKVRLFFNINHNKNNKKTDFKAYQSLIEKLIYLACNTKPDILFIIGQLGRYNLDLKVDYM